MNRLIVAAIAAVVLPPFDRVGAGAAFATEAECVDGLEKVRLLVRIDGLLVEPVCVSIPSREVRR